MRRRTSQAPPKLNSELIIADVRVSEDRPGNQPYQVLHPITQEQEQTAYIAMVIFLGSWAVMFAGLFFDSRCTALTRWSGHWSSQACPVDSVCLFVDARRQQRPLNDLPTVCAQARQSVPQLK